MALCLVVRWADWTLSANESFRELNREHSQMLIWLHGSRLFQAMLEGGATPQSIVATLQDASNPSSPFLLDGIMRTDVTDSTNIRWASYLAAAALYVFRDSARVRSVLRQVVPDLAIQDQSTFVPRLPFLLEWSSAPNRLESFLGRAIEGFEAAFCDAGERLTEISFLDDAISAAEADPTVLEAWSVLRTLLGPVWLSKSQSTRINALLGTLHSSNGTFRAGSSKECHKLAIDVGEGVALACSDSNSLDLTEALLVDLMDLASADSGPDVDDISFLLITTLSLSRFGEASPSEAARRFRLRIGILMGRFPGILTLLRTYVENLALGASSGELRELLPLIGDLRRQ